MEYNTTRSKMLMPEYGRNVQKMVEFILTIDDNEKKLKMADALIELMGTLNPHLKAIEDYKHKLWDHLYQMTDFRLVVENGPYPPPLPEEIHRKPEVLPYPQHSLTHRHLGKNLNSLLEKALVETDENKKQGFTQAVGYYMKLAYTNWHKEPIHDDMIRNELAEMTNGQLQYETGGYKVHFDSRPNNNFKRNGNNSAAANGNNPNNRNFKNAGPRNNNTNNNNPRGNSFGGNPNSVNNVASPNANSGTGNAGGYNNFNKNRKFNKNNKNKNPQ